MAIALLSLSSSLSIANCKFSQIESNLSTSSEFEFGRGYKKCRAAFCRQLIGIKLSVSILWIWGVAAMKLNLSHAEVDGLTGDITLSEDSTFQFSAVDEQNIIPPSSRNAACPCGSGLKYKQCHGKI